MRLHRRLREIILGPAEDPRPIEIRVTARAGRAVSVWMALVAIISIALYGPLAIPPAPETAVASCGCP